MSQFKSFLETVYFRLPGMVDSDQGKVSTDHACCSYGQAVIVMRDGTALGPGDVQGGLVQAHGKQAELLAASGFIVVNSIAA